MADEAALFPMAFRMGLRLGKKVGGGEADPKSASEPAGGAAQKSPPVPHYVVYSAPAGFEDLVGIHHRLWAEFLEVLPAQSLIGSGVQNGKKFNTEAAAIEYFRKKAPEQDVVIFHSA